MEKNVLITEDMELTLVVKFHMLSIHIIGTIPMMLTLIKDHFLFV